MPLEDEARELRMKDWISSDLRGVDGMVGVCSVLDSCQGERERLTAALVDLDCWSRMAMTCHVLLSIPLPRPRRVLSTMASTVL